MNKLSDNVLSIVTICYNNLNGLKATISSIDYQTPIQHIIIDGHSADGTVEYLSSLDNQKITWISEPDKGIYDAMNKGLNMAKGDYVIFMNAGDLFYNTHTIASISDILRNEEPDILYGEAMYIDSHGNHLGLRSDITTRQIPYTLHWRDMTGGMLVCHQSFIVRRSLAPPYIMNNLSADIDWQIKCLKSAVKARYYNQPICQYLIGGTSQQEHIKSLKDRFIVMMAHYGLGSTIWHHLLIIVRAIRFSLAKILPHS